jgi:hypothetical protein
MAIFEVNSKKLKKNAEGKQVDTKTLNALQI